MPINEEQGASESCIVLLRCGFFFFFFCSQSRPRSFASSKLQRQFIICIHFKTISSKTHLLIASKTECRHSSSRCLPCLPCLVVFQCNCVCCCSSTTSDDVFWVQEREGKCFWLNVAKSWSGLGWAAGPRKEEKNSEVASSKLIFSFRSSSSSVFDRFLQPLPLLLHWSIYRGRETDRQNCLLLLLLLLMALNLCTFSSSSSSSFIFCCRVIDSFRMWENAETECEEGKWWCTCRLKLLLLLNSLN